ncbi:hypothetical protein [Microbispora sp. KK1-11]|uniref:hypothetical protein n=1 Tax=Microbispora sp. KK1-11 TaxID=2053005 RepID=UPI0011576E9D|nr:hypothetical protein [Microbispora sp. KK1-11]TQS27801.1 hypothetical protein FLW16_17730 [Microbispora sp. KK1-11]
MTSRAVVLVSIAAILVLTGCERGEQRPVPSPDDVQRRGEALVAVVQCFVDSGVIPSSELSGRSWLVSGRVEPDAAFTTWVASHADTVYRGKTLQAWEDEATAGWPGWKCPL